MPRSPGRKWLACTELGHAAASARDAGPRLITLCGTGAKTSTPYELIYMNCLSDISKHSKSLNVYCSLETHKSKPAQITRGLVHSQLLRMTALSLSVPSLPLARPFSQAFSSLSLVHLHHHHLQYSQNISLVQGLEYKICTGIIFSLSGCGGEYKSGCY